MPESFRLDKPQRKRLLQAIRDFEKTTSAELKVVVAKNAKSEAMDYAKREFLRLGLAKTQLRNAILICVLPKQRKIVVLGDEGIHQALPQGSWERVVELIVAEFREGRFDVGLGKAIQEVADLMAQYFPYHSDDVNEVSDEIVER